MYSKVFIFSWKVKKFKKSVTKVDKNVNAFKYVKNFFKLKFKG